MNASEMHVSILEFKRIFGIQEDINSRMHYLRWNSEETPALLDECNVKYDSSVMFADRCGFKSGTSREFSMFDFNAEKILTLKQKPLIVMENTLFSAKYMNMKSADAIQLIEEYKIKTKKFGGVFTILWHASGLTTEFDRRVYERMVRPC